MALSFSNMIVGGDPEPIKGEPLTFSGQKNSFAELLQSVMAPTEVVTESIEPAVTGTLLKSETNEAEELFSELRVSKYVLDMYDSNR